MSAMPDAVVIFGASGFIGRNIVDALAGKVGRLIGITNRTPAVPGCTAVTSIHELRDVQALPPDTVIINAAAARYDASTFRAQQSEILECNVRIANDDLPCNDGGRDHSRHGRIHVARAGEG